jgi:hypothetical protein
MRSKKNKCGANPHSKIRNYRREIDMLRADPRHLELPAFERRLEYEYECLYKVYCHMFKHDATVEEVARLLDVNTARVVRAADMVAFGLQIVFKI